MYTGQMDAMTLIFYVVLGACIALCVRRAKQAQGTTIEISPKIQFDHCVLYYALIVLVLTFFAVFRKIGDNLGGSDAYTYSQFFVKIHDPDSPYTHLIEEPLFLLFCNLLRMVTDNYRIYFALSYGFIAVAYCVFINKFCRKNMEFIPFLMMTFLYLKSFCTLRTSMAVAVFLLAVVLFDRHKILSMVVMVAAVFVHRASIALVPFPVFYLLFHKLIEKLTGVRLAGFLFAVAFLGIWAARGLQFLILQFGLLDTSDTWYLSMSLDSTLFGRIPMFLMHLLLFLGLSILADRLEDSPNTRLLKNLCCYDIVIMPATLVLGLWRYNEYLYLARLAMWGMLIPAGETFVLDLPSRWKWLNHNRLIQKLTEGNGLRILYRVGVALFVLAWFLFRIYSEWDDLKIMPYVLDFT